MTIANYIQANKDNAIKEASLSKIPASITLAQGILESAAGNSRLAKEANNHFGIKCHSDWYGEHITASDDAPNECFRKYKTVLDSYKDHTNFLKKHARYSKLFDLGVTNYIGWARGLQNAGYATSNSYANTLIKIINDNQLYKYDNQVAFYKVEKYIEIALIVFAIALLIYLGYRIKKKKKTS